MSLGVAQQVETRTMDKAQNSTCAIVFILFADFPLALVGIKISYFSNYFFIFSPNRCNTRSNHKNLHLKQRWDVAYRKSGAFLKYWKIIWKPQNSFFPNFFEFFEISSKQQDSFIVCTEFLLLSTVKN